MADLNIALSSGNLLILLGTAFSLGLLHTVLGPDHYLPFVMMARAQGWSRRKTAIVTFFCGCGHVLSSVVIGAFLAWAGMAATEWAGSRWAFWHDVRGNLSAWLLIGVGVAFIVWGIVRAFRGATHSHAHLHSDTTEHIHEHSHQHSHAHVHTDKTSSITPWVLFIIFIFGPCESLIPLMLSAWSISGIGGVALVSIVFGLTTVITIMGAVALLMVGINRLPLDSLDRWSTSLAGLSLVACGAAIQWLGL